MTGACNPMLCPTHVSFLSLGLILIFFLDSRVSITEDYEGSIRTFVRELGILLFLTGLYFLGLT